MAVSIILRRCIHGGWRSSEEAAAVMALDIVMRRRWLQQAGVRPEKAVAVTAVNVVLRLWRSLPAVGVVQRRRRLLHAALS